jgi:hypothetical protein
MKYENEHDHSKLLYELVGMLYELVSTNLENSKFSDLDVMMVSILMQRCGHEDEKQVSGWIDRCKKEHGKLLDESSPNLAKKVYKSLHSALSQSVTIVKANNVTINKNYQE